MWHASDIGSGRDKLQATFPEGRYDFSDLPDVWWYTVDPSNPRAVGLEPEGRVAWACEVLGLVWWGNGD